jgi:hypothetical protein
MHTGEQLVNALDCASTACTALDDVQISAERIQDQFGLLNTAVVTTSD